MSTTTTKPSSSTMTMMTATRPTTKTTTSTMTSAEQDTFHITQKDFEYFYRKLSPPNERINKQMMAAILSCCGKTLIIDQLLTLWPSEKEIITMDEAYSLYLKYYSPPLVCELSKDDEKIFEQIEPKTIFDCLKNSGFEDAIPGIEKYLLENNLLKENHFNVHSFLKQMQRTREELLNKQLLRVQSVIKEDAEAEEAEDEVEVEVKETEIVKKAYGFFITTPTLISVKTKIRISKEIKGTITLRLGRNSDMIFTDENHPYEYDVVAIVVSETNEFLGITNSIIDNEVYTTDEIVLKPNSSIYVISLGTSIPIRRRSNVAKLQNADGRLTKNFKMVLMNIFDLFDFNGDGLLSSMEFNTFLFVSGDEVISNERDWDDLLEMFDSRDNCLTVAGFIELQQMEMSVGEENAVKDTFVSLKHLGYTDDLKLIHGCPYILEVISVDDFELESDASRLDVNDRNLILSILYKLGRRNKKSDIVLSFFQTSYFGMAISRKEDIVNDESFQIVLNEEKNVKMTFLEGKTDIRPVNSSTDWILFLTYSITQPDHRIDFSIRKQEK